MDVFVIVIVALIFGGCIWWAHLEEKKSKQRRNFLLSKVAGSLRLCLSDWESEHAGWPLFENSVFLKKGHSRYAYNVMIGEFSGREVHAFDYHYAITTSNGKSTTTTHYNISCVAISLDRRYPALSILKEGIDSKIAQFFGYDDIDFESKYFSDKYCVRSESKRFAYDVITPAMMEYLLSRPGLYFEITGKTLLVAHDELVAPQEMVALINRAVKTRDLIPEHVMPA